MNCDHCIKLNPLPSCISTLTFLINGITFPDYLSEIIIAKFTNTATGAKYYLPLLTNGAGEITGGFDVATIYPLMSHWYKLEFQFEGTPANFLLTNPDNTTEEGCCLEFTVNEGQEGATEWNLSSTVCAA